MENDIDRIRRLASEAARLFVDVIGEIPKDMKKSEMTYYQRFGHNLPRNLNSICQNLSKPPITPQTWNTVRALFKQQISEFNNVFATYAEEKHGFDPVGAMTLIQSVQSFELEIEDDRASWQDLGEDALRLYDEVKEGLDSIEDTFFGTVPSDLRILLKAKQKIDEARQLAERNMSPEPAADLPTFSL